MEAMQASGPVATLLRLIDRALLAVERGCRWLIRHQAPRWFAVALVRRPWFLQSKLYYFFSSMRAASIARQVPARPPACLYVETTNLCDAKCIICSHPVMERTKRTMETQLYERAIDQAAALGIPRVQLNATGEPLLDKNISSRIAYAKNKGISFATLFSNASTLTEETGLRLLESGLDLIIFSLDGLTAAEFERVRPPLKFDRVYGNVVRFCRQKLASRQRKPEIRVQITPVDQDPCEIRRSKAFRELSELADRVMFTPPPLIHDWTGNVTGLASVSQSQRPSTMSLPCSRLYNTMTVLSDGRVPVCSIDYEGRVELGNLRRQSLAEIWSGAAFAAVRAAHETSKVDDLELCSRCSYRPSWLEWY